MRLPPCLTKLTRMVLFMCNQLNSDSTSSEAFETSSTSTETVDSSNCDPYEPEVSPAVVTSDLGTILASWSYHVSPCTNLLYSIIFIFF